MHSHFDPGSYNHCITEGLRLLGVDNLFLQIHDPSFPSFADEDTGRGSPYTWGGMGFLRRICNIGFTGIQLGPQGATSDINASPYDGTVFSRNPLSVALYPLLAQGLLDETELAALLARVPPGRERVHYREAFQLSHEAMALAYRNFCRLREQRDPRVAELAEQLVAFRATERGWLERDALYAALSEANGGRGWRDWPEVDDRRLWYPGIAESLRLERHRTVLRERHKGALERYGLVQLLAHHQHAALREYCADLGLKLYADLQIGVADQDAWAYRPLFLRGYRMGAPPSRTNTQGQPWGFVVLDPRQYFEPDGRPGPVLRFVDARLRKVHAEYDGLRVDHPQGWVTPWVYRTDIPDRLQAVQQGARLFSSPDLPDHPELAAFAIVRPDQLNRDLPRHHDNWVRELDDEQITHYAALFTYLLPHREEGRREVMCEVLSTLPAPLGQVMARYGLGRFRVLQNADPDDPYDVYRSDRARPPDWIMLGNHDTSSIWQLAERWCAEDGAQGRAADLATRLVPDPRERPAWIQRCCREPGLLVHALFADMLHSQARNIMVFVSDMLGVTERYNTPGTVNNDNWSLRVPPDFEESYLKRLASDRALSLPYAIWLALKARPGGVDEHLLRATEQEMIRLRAVGERLG